MCWKPECNDSPKIATLRKKRQESAAKSENNEGGYFRNLTVIAWNWGIGGHLEVSEFILSSIPHKKINPLSLGLRLSRICSDDTTIRTRCDELSEQLQKRGYKQSQVPREITKAQCVTRDQALQPSRSQQKRSHGIPFVVTHNPASPYLNKIITKHLPILQSSNRCKEAFSERPFIAYRRPRN